MGDLGSLRTALRDYFSEFLPPHGLLYTFGCPGAPISSPLAQNLGLQPPFLLLAPRDHAVSWAKQLEDRKRQRQQVRAPPGTPAPLIAETGSPQKFKFPRPPVADFGTAFTASRGAGVQEKEEKGTT